MSAGLKVLLLGSENPFSTIVLEHLLSCGVNVCGLGLRAPAPPGGRGPSIPVMIGALAPAVALEHDVPLVGIHARHDDRALEAARALAPDVVLVACFPMILGSAWRALAAHGCINVHPSLLPSYRGPAPLFWQFREGEPESGVTLHVVEAAVDAGDIVAQSAVPVPAGATMSGLNAELALAGAELAADLVEHLSAGIEVPRTRQDPALASYQPMPKESDFRFDTHFTAERAYRFIEGTREWGVPFEIDVGSHTAIVERALDYHDTAKMRSAFEVDGDRMRIRCSEGVLEAVGHLLRSGED